MVRSDPPKRSGCKGGGAACAEEVAGRNNRKKTDRQTTDEKREIILSPLNPHPTICPQIVFLAVKALDVVRLRHCPQRSQNDIAMLP